MKTVREKTLESENRTLLNEIALLEQEIDDNAETISDLTFSRDLQKSNFMVALEMGKNSEAKLDEMKKQVARLEDILEGFH